MLVDRDGYRCRRCFRLIRFQTNGLDPEGATIGHIVPASKGGSDALSNLRLEHRRCNIAAGARPDSPRGPLAHPIPLE
jgi:5-methylcytosine-specific restriction endonuclease McrA